MTLVTRQAGLAWPSQLSWLTEPTLGAQATGLLLVLLAAFLVDKVAKQVLLTTVGRVVKRTAFVWDDVLQDHHVFGRLAHLAPAITIYYGVQLLPNLPPTFEEVVVRAAMAAMIFVALLSVGALLSSVQDLYARTPAGRDRPIKGYIQIAKIVMYVVGGIVIAATLLGRSPFLFLSGIGAMTAVLLLVFRDTILSFVASLQVASYDLMRVGDWIEAPQYGADGDVIDIALHTVKIQNWDKTITIVPTHKLIEGAFKNWRGMSESGGRRIKRALYLDMATIRFLSDDDIERLSGVALLREYLKRKRDELAGDASDDGELNTNRRRLTNIGTFRAYVVSYLRQHAKVHQGLTLMVRQRDPTPDGLPLEIYAFTNTTEWVAYEGIQSDIFDHILAVAPEFGLRVFQHPSGRDFERAFAATRS